MKKEKESKRVGDVYEREESSLLAHPLMEVMDMNHLKMDKTIE